MYNKAIMIAELKDIISALKQIIESVESNFKEVDTTDDVIKSTTDALKISVDDLKSNKRTRHLTEARFIVCYLLKKHTTLSLRQIGALIGNRDHSTVIYGIQKYQNFIDTNDKMFTLKVKHVENKLGGKLCV